MEQSRKIELLSNYLDLDISTNISDFENADCMIYEESTADGYSVYICSNDNKYPNICEDVYYYDHDLPNAFEEHIRYGDRTFYIEDYLYEECYFEDKLEEMFSEKVEDIIEEFEGTEEELNYLKEEYGIEDEKTEEIGPIIT